ncbi:MAG: lamin tail domain-containing protein [Anaerolineae bacterium]|nr:lamin tail domain-containing protein [Anaerolineae bacterium]
MESLPSPIPAQPVTVTQGSEAVVAITAVIAPGDLSNEAVQIVNSGGSPIALLGWKIVDLQNHIYTFKQVTLFGDGAGILFHTGPGRDGATDVFGCGRTRLGRGRIGHIAGRARQYHGNFYGACSRIMGRGKNAWHHRPQGGAVCVCARENCVYAGR